MKTCLLLNTDGLNISLSHTIHPSVEQSSQQHGLLPQLEFYQPNQLQQRLRATMGRSCFGTILQYLSGVYIVLKTSHLRLPLWQENLVITENSSVPQWYNTLRGNISRIVTNRVIQSGEKLQNKSEPIGRNLLIQMTLALLARNDLESVEMATTFVLHLSCILNHFQQDFIIIC